MFNLDFKNNSTQPISFKSTYYRFLTNDFFLLFIIFNNVYFINDNLGCLLFVIWVLTAFDIIIVK